MLTDAEIVDKKNELYFNKSQGEGLSGNERVIDILINDLQQTRQDLRDLYLLSSGETPIALGEFRERLKQKYGWEEGT